MNEEPDILRDDLLPCPFCGGEASVSEGTQGGADAKPWWYIECEGCMATTDSVEMWNARTAAPEVDALKVAQGLEQMAMEQRNKAFDDLEKLAHAARNAEAKLRYLGNVFSGRYFTDRHGDGPVCLAIADALKCALPQRVQSQEDK